MSLEPQARETPPWGDPSSGPVRDPWEPPPPGAGQVAPPAARRGGRRTAAVVGALVVVAVLGLVVTQVGTTSPQLESTAAQVSDWPTVGPASPTTPAAGVWAGSLPPPTPTQPSSADPPTATDAAAAAGPAPAAAPPGFCLTARTELASIGSDGLAALRDLAAHAGDAAPQARALVQQALDRADQLRRQAPPALSDAAGTLAEAWHGLSVALERAGYDAGHVTLQALKDLGDPAVAEAVRSLGSWATRNCGSAGAQAAAG